jgi:hypothetical protein
MFLILILDCLIIFLKGRCNDMNWLSVPVSPAVWCVSGNTVYINNIHEHLALLIYKLLDSYLRGYWRFKQYFLELIQQDKSIFTRSW